MYTIFLPVKGGTRAPPKNNRSQISRLINQKVSINGTGMPIQQLAMQKPRQT